MVKQYHQLNGHEFEQTQGDSGWRTGKPGMLLSMGCKELDTTWQLSDNMVYLWTFQVTQGKESACNEGDLEDSGLVFGSGRSLGGGHGNPLQYSCLKNPMDRGAWWATVHRSPSVGHD